MMHKPPLALGVALLCAAALVACGTRTGTLNKIQLHTPLECPCPTIAPLASYNLPSPNSYLGGIATGSDGNIWLTEGDDNLVARVTPSGTITEFSIPTAGAYPGIIRPGPDGNLWAVDYNFNIIHRITPAGVISEFPLPPPLATAPPNLSDIAIGPDGNLWFTSSGANVVGVMSTSGNLLASYSIPTANSGVGFIVKGSDGNMWFGEEGTPTNCVYNIGRITMSGTITEFPIPTPTCDEPWSAIGGATVGADGNVWFTERFNAKVARITPSGVITEFPQPVNPANETLVRIVSAPDGSLWFEHNQLGSPWTAQVGKMDLSGNITDLWSFPDAILAGMTIGPDGSPWFTDQVGDRVLEL